MDIEKIAEKTKKNYEASFSDTSIKDLVKKHKKKSSYIDIETRIFSGCIQSLNIKLGDIYVGIVEGLLESSSEFELHPLSGKYIKRNISDESDLLIENYVKKRIQERGKVPNEDFQNLLLLINENEPTTDTVDAQYDVDLLFQSVTGDKLYYFEAKLTDDHDTGKYEELNGRIFKTYGYLNNALSESERKNLQPGLVFWKDIEKPRPVYFLPEIYYGSNFFETFLGLDISDIDVIMNDLAQHYAPFIKEKYHQIVVDQKYTV